MEAPMHSKSDSTPYDPAVITDLTFTFARIMERRPSETALILRFLKKNIKLQKRKRTHNQQLALIAELCQKLIPKVLKSAQWSKVQGPLLEEYAKLPHTPATRLKKNPHDHSVEEMIVVGIVLALLVACIVVAATGSSEETGNQDTSDSGHDPESDDNDHDNG
jgi:hypothetical protein